MRYYWLNQRPEDASGYRDSEGEVYHYRSSVAGSNKLSEGDLFVYYRPGEHVLFGTGQIDEIEALSRTTKENDPTVVELQPKVSKSTQVTEYEAHIENYTQFENPVSARSVKSKISFLKDKKGLTGVPQNSIYEIDERDFLTILDAAGEEPPIPIE